jgi:hypothetical protein
MTDGVAATPDLRLADHFPRAPKACARVSEDFFACFSEKGNQTNPPVRLCMFAECVAASVFD